MGIFIGIAILIWQASPQSVVTEFFETKTPVAVINRDGDAPLAQGRGLHRRQLYGGAIPG